MNKSISDRKRDLFYESFRLRNLSMKTDNVEKQKEIREQQNDAYRRLKFFENYEKAYRKVVDNA